jgi:hypothetical protein
MKRIIFIISICLGGCLSIIGQISKNISVNQSDLKIEKAGEYDKISLDNVFYMTDIVGQPELPVYIQSFVIPVDAKLNGVTVNGVNRQKLSGNYYINPVQPQIPSSFLGSINNLGLLDMDIYNSSMPYPGKQAEIILDELYLGYRIITVKLYPVEYIPKAKELYLCNFNFYIDYSTNIKGDRNEFVAQTQSLYRYEMNKSVKLS